MVRHRRDGIGDLRDEDDDGDGVDDKSDPVPLDGSETRDTDQDMVGDNADLDDDNDLLVDTIDLHQFVPLPQSSSFFRHVPLFPADSTNRQGFARIVAREEHNTKISIGAGSDAGLPLGNVRMEINSGTVMHFNPDHLRRGDPARGLQGSIAGRGNWRLERVCA